MIERISYRFDNNDWRYYVMNKLEYKIVCTACSFKIYGYSSEDLVQELRLEIWKNLPKFDNQRAGVKTWAEIVMRSHINHLRIKITKTKKRKDYLCEPIHMLPV